MEAPVVPLRATTSPRVTVWPSCDGGGRQVVVRGLQAVAMVHHYAVAAAILVPADERHGAAGSSQNRRAALGHEVLAAVEVTGTAGDGADPESER